ncbi:haloacid dehalogenase [Bordetella pertussis]|nr:haloacid dehalogenase [Bordetella pertussis]
MVTNCSRDLGRQAAGLLGVDLARPQGAPEPELQSATLAVALPWLQAFRPAVR